MTLLEICVDSYESALKAWKGGADRIELCHNLSVGGLTPTAGLISIIKKSPITIPVFVLIRPRPGDFNYSSTEVQQMLVDIEISKQMGADGLVFGALTGDNKIDLDTCKTLVDASRGLPVTFHRAFDETKDKKESLEHVIELGFNRILTAGAISANSDISGSKELSVLRELILEASDRIIIIPGGGVCESNIRDIIEFTKAKEIHSSARSRNLNGETVRSKECSEEIIKSMKKLLQL